MVERISSSRVAQAALLASLLLVGGPAMSASVTNMNFVGGCPQGEDDPECFDSGNATLTNVALVLGVDESDVSFVGEQSDTSSSSAFSVTGIGFQDGTWQINDSSITHLAFKADGYYILGEVTGSSGDWSTDITMWSPDFSTLTCPVGICAVERAYTQEDFLNGGTSIADLSNVRAFSVVPIPAAVWLFGSALAGLGFARRKKAA